MKNDFDLIVIGAGPGGYGAAIRGSQLGLKVAVVEGAAAGGVCLNWGCIPSKNLIHQASVFGSMVEMESVGVSVDRGGLDYKKVFEKSRAAVQTLVGGVESLLSKNNVVRVSGWGKIAGPHEVVVDGTETYRAENILVATGSRPMEIPGFEFDEKTVLSSTGILSLTELPSSLIIMGGGAIGCEFAYVMNAFGVEVSLVEMATHLLPLEDYETCAVLQRSFSRRGINVLTETRALSLAQMQDKLALTIEGSTGQTSLIEAEKLLVVCGRVPNTEDLCVGTVDLKLSPRSHIEVGNYGQTCIPSIYAIGDVTATPALAHVASREGELAVEHMAGHAPRTPRVDPDLIPSAVYCEPEVAGFGLREDCAAGIDYKKSVFSLPGAGKTIAIGKPEGMVKILCDKNTDELLGAHVVGHNATELLHELLLAKHGELLPDDIADMIHAHPTISEASMEAARGINGRPIHA